MATQYRLPVYKKIQGKGWEEVKEEPVDPQATLRYYQAILNEWNRNWQYRILQAEAEELQQKKRDIQEIMENLVENIAVNQYLTALLQKDLFK